jgi:ADP-heptose:LPS heptosyltransferase
MKTAAKFLIDRTVAVPFAWAANLTARAVAPIARRDHHIDPEHIHTIAVAKLLGMGSIIQATPLLHDLRAHFPKAKIIFITTRANKGLMDRLDVVDEAVYVDDANPGKLVASTATALVELLTRRIDLYFDLEVYSAGASVLAVVSGARNREGFYRYSARFKKGIFTHLTVFNPRAPISAIYRQLHVAVGGFEQGEPKFGPITVREEDRRSLDATLAKLGIRLDERFVLVNPNASDLLLERRWPTGRVVQLATELAKKGEQVVFVGAKSEAQYVGDIIGDIALTLRPRIVDTSGKLSLGELFALLERASCVVTNDTGPMHFSIALNRPTVCLFGPVSPEHYGVRKANVEMIYHPVYCSPCAHELDFPPCDGNNVCMKLIDVGEVLAAVERRLAGAPAVTRLKILDVAYQEKSGKALGVIVRASTHTGPPAVPPPDTTEVPEPHDIKNGARPRRARQ